MRIRVSSADNGSSVTLNVKPMLRHGKPCRCAELTQSQLRKLDSLCSAGRLLVAGYAKATLTLTGLYDNGSECWVLEW